MKRAQCAVLVYKILHPHDSLDSGYHSSTHLTDGDTEAQARIRAQSPCPQPPLLTDRGQAVRAGRDCLAEEAEGAGLGDFGVPEMGGT